MVSSKVMAYKTKPHSPRANDEPQRLVKCMLFGRVLELDKLKVIIVVVSDSLAFPTDSESIAPPQATELTGYCLGFGTSELQNSVFALSRRCRQLDGTGHLVARLSLIRSSNNKNPRVIFYMEGTTDKAVYESANNTTPMAH
jgi:hypothetical protein